MKDISAPAPVCRKCGGQSEWHKVVENPPSDAGWYCSECGEVVEGAIVTLIRFAFRLFSWK